MIYTGYFARLKYYQSNGLTPFRISNGGINIINPYIWQFVPEWDLVQNYKKGLITDEQYKVLYIKELNSFNKTKLKYLLDELNSKNSILLCYESPNKFCHRHILAEWIKDNFGYNVVEFP